MHPSKFGDTYEMAKLCMLRWLWPRQEDWTIHPMYFPELGEERIDGFPLDYARFLGINCVDGNIWAPAGLADVVAGWRGHLFLDPDTGLWEQGDAKHVGFGDLIAITQAETREHRLTLVYDQSLNYNHEAYGTPHEQVRMKLTRLREANLYAAAYVSHIAFLWVSTDASLVREASGTLLQASRLPMSRFVDDGCAHFV